MIWKQELKVTDLQSVLLPSGAEILSAGNQAGHVCIWFSCYPARLKESRTIEIIGTGHEYDRAIKRRFIGTVQQSFFVWHIFERLSE